MTHNNCITAVLLRKMASLLDGNNTVATMPDSAKPVSPLVLNNPNPPHGSQDIDVAVDKNVQEAKTFAGNKPPAPGGIPQPALNTPQTAGAKETPKSTGKLQGLAGS